MAHVDFFILPDTEATGLISYACRLAQQSWSSGKRVLLQTENSEQSQQLDDALWNIADDAFIPHAIATLEPVDLQQPVLISHQKVKPQSFQHVINLSCRPCDIEQPQENAASEATGVLKIDEILNQNEERKHCGRLNYKFYRALGYTLEHHKVEN